MAANPAATFLQIVLSILLTKEVEVRLSIRISVTMMSLVVGGDFINTDPNHALFDFCGRESWILLVYIFVRSFDAIKRRIKRRRRRRRKGKGVRDSKENVEQVGLESVEGMMMKR